MRSAPPVCRPSNPPETIRKEPIPMECKPVHCNGLVYIAVDSIPADCNCRSRRRGETKSATGLPPAAHPPHNEETNDNANTGKRGLGPHPLPALPQGALRLRGPGNPPSPGLRRLRNPGPAGGNPCRRRSSGFSTPLATNASASGVWTGTSSPAAWPTSPVKPTASWIRKGTRPPVEISRVPQTRRVSECSGPAC